MQDKDARIAELEEQLQQLIILVDDLQDAVPPEDAPPPAPLPEQGDSHLDFEEEPPVPMEEDDAHSEADTVDQPIPPPASAPPAVASDPDVMRLMGVVTEALTREGYNMTDYNPHQE